MVRIAIRDRQGWVVKVVDCDETESAALLGQIEELQRERDDLRKRLSEAESRRAFESNRLHREQREAHETGERVNAQMFDLIGAAYRESSTWLEEKIRLREERDAERQRANAESERAAVYERALVQAQAEARAVIAESARRDGDPYARPRRRRPDVNERALEAFAARLGR